MIATQGPKKTSTHVKCEHGKQKAMCKECGGSGICTHGKIKRQCKECGGSAFCTHGREKARCKECGGSAFCTHGKLKAWCKECGGSAICTHGKLKARCKECGGSALCKSPHCETIAAVKRYNGYCLRCVVHLFPDTPVFRNYKTKETAVVTKVREWFPDLSWIADRKVADGCSSRRPDLLVDMGSHVLVLEVDEEAHAGYDCSCENKRIMQISMDVGHRPLVFLRFNPDGYVRVADGVKVTTCWRPNKLGVLDIPKSKRADWEHRLVALRATLETWLTQCPEKTVEIVELFY